MKKSQYIKIDGCWWRLCADRVQLVVGNSYKVENEDGGYHYHTLTAEDEVKSFSGRDAWEDNYNHSEEPKLYVLYSGSYNGIAEHSVFPLGKAEGYVTREGRFIDVSSYDNGQRISAHANYCEEKGIDEEEMLSEQGWVKLTRCLDSGYIFYGRHLSEEQREMLDGMGYEIED